MTDSSLPETGTADSFLRFEAVRAQTGLSRTTIHRLIKSGDFPSPKRLGVRAVAWLSSDVARWRDGRPDARGHGAA
jgi:prophage regulatory protein